MRILSATTSAAREGTRGPAPEHYADERASAGTWKTPPIMIWAFGITLVVALLVTLLVPKEAPAQEAPDETGDAGDRKLTLANGDRRIEIRDGCVRIEAGEQRLQTGDCSDGSRAELTGPVDERPEANGLDGDADTPEETLNGLIERCSGRVREPGEATAAPRTAAGGKVEVEGESATGEDLSAEQCRIVLEAVSAREPSQPGERTTTPENGAAELGPVGDQYGGAEDGATEPEGDGGSPEESPETTQEAPEGTTREPVEEGGDGPSAGAPGTTGEATAPEPTSEPPLPAGEPTGNREASGEQYREEPTEAAPEAPTQYAAPPESAEPAPVPDRVGLSGFPAGDASEPATEVGEGRMAPSDDYPAPALPTESTPDGPVAVLPDTGGPPVAVLAVVPAVVAGVGLAVRRIRERR